MNDYETLRKHDCFYTLPEVAEECLKTLRDELEKPDKKASDFDLWLEPSVGKGAFFNLLPPRKRHGIDIRNPSNLAIEESDFLEWSYDQIRSKYKNIITIGNPPFGKNSSLAMKFFNRSAEFSNCIAMIFPQTFLKASVKNRLNANFILLKSRSLREQSFEFNNEPYSVPCVFQIWKRQQVHRKVKILPLTHTDFEFTTRDQAEFAVQRVGVAAGKIKEDFEKYADQSHYFIKSMTTKVNILNEFKKINWDSVKHNTAGNPSISKRELVNLYTKVRGKK